MHMITKCHRSLRSVWMLPP